MVQVNDYMPVGDTTGKQVFTKHKYIYDCKETITKQGKCIKWKRDNSIYDYNPDEVNISFRDEEFSGSMGRIIALISKFNAIDNLFTGGKGYCVKGIETDFSWMGDPYMWASMAASAYFTGAEGKVENAYAVSSGQLTKELATYAKCAVEAGIDVAKNTDAFFNSDPVPCDPVDEICEEESNDDEELYTLDSVQYNDLITSNPEFADWVTLLRESDGVVLLKVTPPETDSSTLSAQEAVDKAEKLRLMIFKIQSAITTLALTACMASGGVISAGSSGSGSKAGKFSVKQGASATISSFPLDPYTKIGIQLALNFATSFTPIDSCNKKSDAKKKGSRHLKTYESTKHGRCHYIREGCRDAMLGTCNLKERFSCCYDQKMTKILVEQVKAQLAKDWQHCSDFTLKELGYVSFRQCSAAEMASAPNGVTMAWNASYTERKSAFQFVNKCMDLTEFKEWIEQQTGETIPMDAIEEQFEDIQKSI